MALEYPYADNLHLLLAIKAQQLNHPELEQCLQASWLHAVDRKHFFAETHKVPAYQPPEPETVPMVHPEASETEKADLPLGLSFRDWYAGFNLQPAKPRKRQGKSVSTVVQDATTRDADPLPASAKGMAQQLAAESVRPRSGVKSATLALMLASQGDKKGALAMLEQLMLDNPEKSAYFAAEIEKIKQQ